MRKVGSSATIVIILSKPVPKQSLHYPNPMRKFDKSLPGKDEPEISFP